jgi:YidC/Oxa1 family membrane protein insertase
MDKNQAIGFLLMAALLLVYFWFFAPKPQELPQEPATSTEQTTGQKTQKSPELRAMRDETQQEAQAVKEKLADTFFEDTARIEEQLHTLENEKIKVTWTNRGGVISEVVLKEYTDYRNLPLALVDASSSAIDYLINTADGTVNISDLMFDQVTKSADGDTSTIEFTAHLGDGQRIVHRYRLIPDDYQVEQRSVMRGLDNTVQDDVVTLQWFNEMKRLETDLEYSRYYTTINYFEVNEGFDNLKPRSTDREEYTFNAPVQWFAFKQKFFTAGVVFDQPFNEGVVYTELDEGDTTVVKTGTAVAKIPLARFADSGNEMVYFFGPNRLQILKRMGYDFSENLYLGWPVIDLINKYVIIPLFSFLERYFSNYGIIIIILVFILKIILSPLTYKSHISMAKTRVLKPELDELKEKYGDDMQKMQSEQMKLYQQVGVNPLSGCIPILLQMPILFAMFQFIPHAIELRQKSFLWADDLSTYDSIVNLPFDVPGYGDRVSLFTLLMTLSTILYTWANSQATASMQGPMKSMQYIMPIVFMFVLNKFPAGLTFYYFVSNILSFGQIALIRRFVDDEKIRTILDENKKRNKTRKKSSFQARLEEAMKASQDNKKKGTGTGTKKR